MAFARASNGRFDANEGFGGGMNRAQRMQREAVVCECYLHGIEHKLSPLNQLAISPTRFVSPATNKQQNERAALSRIGNDCLRNAPDSWFRVASLDGNLSSSVPARPDTLLECRFKFGSDLYLLPSGYILIGVVELARHPHLNTEHINNFDMTRP